MTEYGLPGSRNASGERKAIDHTYEFDGDEITIQIIPPTISEYEELEQLQQEEDVSPDRLEEVVRKYLIKPDIPESESLTFRETVAFLHGIVDYSAGGTGIDQEILEEIEELQDEQGN